tara:strand:- start:1225 stop:1653 length:429 start_codon:yes stop_codon:yes gene_type:complete
MKVEWDFDDIEDHEDVCWEYTTDGLLAYDEEDWEQVDDRMYTRMHPKVKGLINAAKDLHLAQINQTNLIEWKYRLDCLFDAGKFYLTSSTNEGDIPIRYRFDDLKIFNGLKVNIQSWTKEKFDSSLREIRMRRLLKSQDFEI